MVYWYAGVVLYIVSFLVHTYGVDPSRDDCLDFDTDYHIAKACKCVVFQSYGLSGGTFYSPNYPTPYKTNTNCILYSFIGDVNEIVQITFDDLDILPPKEYSPTLKQCEDRLRIFNSLERAAVDENSRHDAEICGDMSSLEDKQIHSSGRALVMEFHSGGESNKSQPHKGFKGFFKFLEKSKFKTDGQPYGAPCSYLIQDNLRESRGNFFSPKYPQKYPPSSNCKFFFIGREGYTVQLTFKKISLPNRRYSCDETGDYIRIYDGQNHDATVLRSICSRRDEELTVTSSGRYMFVEFRSDWSVQKQGFHGTFLFMNKSSRIPENVADGTPTVTAPNGSFECNQTINSNGKSPKNGTIYSPGYPTSYQTSIQCQYDFHAEGIERIQLVFSEMNLHYSGGNALEPYGCPSQDNIKVYVYQGDRESTLKEFCGKDKPKPLMSSGRRMKVVFKSDDSEKQANTYFRIDYSFRTDFGVLGNGIQDKRDVCTFTFRSRIHSSGFFTSPNYGGWYPRNTECHYLFFGKPNERVSIHFPESDVDGIVPRCDSLDDSDSISFSNYLNADDRGMPRLCGTNPRLREYVSDAAFFRVIFKSDNKYDASGFKALYEFKSDYPKGKDPQDVVPPQNQQSTNGAETIQRHSSNLFVSSLFVVLVSQLL